jgi:hypothetical protein
VKHVKVAIGRYEMRACRRRRRCDPEIVVRERLSTPPRHVSKFGKPLEHRSGTDVHNDHLSEEIIESTALCLTPSKLLRQRQAFTDGHDRNEWTILPMTQVELTIDSLRNLVSSNHVKQDVRVEDQKLARWTQDNS